jgi:RNA polymerase sigma-70 factor, ECF subfamily
VVEERRRAHRAACTKWPEIELSYHEFDRHLCGLGWERELPKQTDELYLCCGCSLGVLEACRRLESDYFPAIKASLARQCGRQDFVEEILQQTRERLLVGAERRIASYRGAAPLSSWLRRVARRLASDLYRKENKYRRLFAALKWGYALDGSEAAASPEASCSNASDSRYLGQLERALVAAMLRLPIEERQLLHLHYVEGLSVDDIARCHQRDRSNVYRRLNQIKARIKRWSLALAEEQTGILNREELDALFRANHRGIYLDLRIPEPLEHRFQWPSETA